PLPLPRPAALRTSGRRGRGGAPGARDGQGRHGRGLGQRERERVLGSVRRPPARPTRRDPGLKPRRARLHQGSAPSLPVSAPHVQRSRGPVTAVVLQFSAARCRGSAVLSAVVPPALTCGFTPRHGVTALLHPLVEKLTVV